MARQPDAPGMDGVLIIAKPAGPTSHDVVALARRLTGTRRIGHGGTLDPFASGVLPLFLGFGVRLVEYHLGDEKGYRATICFGATSTTDDLAGELVPGSGPAPTRDAVLAALAGSVGERAQRPPAYSAIQVGGRRAYDMARAGEAPELALRQVDVRALDLVDWDASDPDRPIAVVDVVCSAGTYVRAIARDLGETLGCGAYLGALARTRSGPFGLDAAVGLDALRAAAAIGPAAVQALLLPADAGLDGMPAVRLTGPEIDDAAKGRFVKPAAGLDAIADGAVVRLLDDDGRIVGIGRRDAGRIAPDKMSRR